MGSYTDPKYVGILMSPVADCDLKAFLERKPFPEGGLHLLRGFFGCLCSAVLYLHRSKCQHKDLKPGNTLIYMNKVLITDFGTARNWSEQSHSTTIGSSGPFTAGYAAPEVVYGDPRSSSADIWSLGCIYLDMMTVLRGETLTSKGQFFAENGTCGANPRSNAEALELWLARLKSETENRPLEWIREMIKTARNDRITAAELMDQIHDYDGQVYYSSCCNREEESDSGTSYQGSICEDTNSIKGLQGSTEIQKDDGAPKSTVSTSIQDLIKRIFTGSSSSLGLLSGKNKIGFEAVSQQSDAAPQRTITIATQLLLDKAPQRAQKPVDASPVSYAAIKARDNLRGESSMLRNQGHWEEAEELDVRVMATKIRMLEHPDALQTPDGPAAVYGKQHQYGEAEQLNSNVAVSASEHTVIRLSDLKTRTLRNTLKGHSSWVNSIAFSPDSKLVASASGDKTIRIWDSAVGMSCSTLRGHSDSVYAVAFSPEGNLIASASGDKTIRLWDSTTRVSCNTLGGHSDSIYSIAFSPDGKLVASASGDNTIRLWNSATGALRGMLKGHSSRVYAVAFSPDDKLVASASGDKMVKLWDSTTGVLRSTLKGHSESVYAVAFSPDGKLVASASYDKTVRLWDSAMGASHSTLEGHSNSVFAVAFSPDGKLVASASGDKTIKFWDSKTGAPCSTLEGHSHSVNAVAFSPDGKLVASASRDKTVRLWGSSIEEVEDYP